MEGLEYHADLMSADIHEDLPFLGGEFFQEVDVVQVDEVDTKKRKRSEEEQKEKDEEGKERSKKKSHKDKLSIEEEKLTETGIADVELREYVKAVVIKKRAKGEKVSEFLADINVTICVNGQIDNASVNEDVVLQKFIKFLDTAPLKTVCLIVENFRYTQTLKKRCRKKLSDVNTVEDVVELLKRANNIIVLSGAGLSVSCGIPDFRSPGGLYETIAERFELPDPQVLFSIDYLKDDPRPFFYFTKELFPSPAHKPSAGHYFIRLLEEKGKLLRNYTQNIDTLEEKAGISRVVHCHGNFATATCINCQHRVSCEEIREEIMQQKVPPCKICKDSSAFMKPDIIFFGEPLPRRFDKCLMKDVKNVDLLIVMGSSLQVRPVALIPDIIGQDNKYVPQILINRELVAKPHEFDVYLEGDCDTHVKELCRRLGWELPNAESVRANPLPSRKAILKQRLAKEEEGGGYLADQKDSTGEHEREKEKEEEDGEQTKQVREAGIC